jgi:hypothetical protein
VVWAVQLKVKWQGRRTKQRQKPPGLGPGLARLLGLSPDHSARNLFNNDSHFRLFNRPKSSLRVLLSIMPRQRASSHFRRNIHLVNADNDEIGGTWQNGSLTWAEMLEWMQITFELLIDEYTPFPCLEDGDPKDPVNQHGAPINMQANTNSIQPQL